MSIWRRLAYQLWLGSFLPNEGSTKVGTLNAAYQSRAPPSGLSVSAFWLGRAR